MSTRQRKGEARSGSESSSNKDEPKKKPFQGRYNPK
jgi:hypothetical protein